MRIGEAKEHFPGLRDKTFLDAACVGLAPIESRLAVERFLEQAVMCPDRDGAVPPEAFAEHIDGRTRAVVVSSVQWTNGYAVDLHGLAEVCHAHGALFVVDAIQQLGATRLSVEDVPADIVVAGGHKWLNAPFGCGLLYVRRSTLPDLRMPSWGYLGLEPPEGGWGRYFATPETTPVRIYVAMRYTSHVGGIRISTHLYNDHDDLDRLLGAMHDLLGRRRTHSTVA